ncbi:8752_t:CDS:10 [Paraglomus brasilianum]|uniref:Vacuolar protein sorting-associated protein 27 n=1 Tax=Paraglomus brasilianum TaxID=144538 RepID=A0A9N8VXP7_9GLOM|nr:8752_t:CDS:10 [Paraglomus brasilianum]
MISRLFANPFDDLVEKATSELLPRGQEDLATNCEISDQIRSKTVYPRDAMRSLKKRIGHSNPNVQLLALSLTDTCVKNGGSHFLIEIASREFVDNLVSIIKAPMGVNLDVKNKILALVQSWGLTFDGKSELQYMTDTYRLLKSEGFPFPKVEKTTAVMIDTETAPEWSDSDVCMRCRTPFTLTNRKHHCRNCGQTFCGECSSKTIALPHFGINEPVRVCDSCFMRRTLRNRSASLDLSPNITKPYLLPPTISAPASKSHFSEDEDDEDIKKAIELSLKEAESSRGRYTSPPQKKPEVKKEEKKAAEEEDKELAAAIAASLKDMENNQKRQSQYGIGGYKPKSTTYESSFSNNSVVHSANELTPLETENIYQFTDLVDRLQYTGGDLMRDRQVQDLYDRIGELKPKLTKSLSEAIQKHQELADMHDKLAQVVKLYDSLLEQRLSSAYMRRTSVYSQPTLRTISPSLTVPPSTAPTYPSITPSHNTSYPLASAPAPSPTYYHQTVNPTQYAGSEFGDGRARQQFIQEQHDMQQGMISGQQTGYSASQPQYSYGYSASQGGYGQNVDSGQQPPQQPLSQQIYQPEQQQLYKPEQSQPAQQQQANSYQQQYQPEQSQPSQPQQANGYQQQQLYQPEQSQPPQQQQANSYQQQQLYQPEQLQPPLQQANGYQQQQLYQPEQSQPLQQQANGYQQQHSYQLDQSQPLSQQSNGYHQQSYQSEQSYPLSITKQEPRKETPLLIEL